MSFPLGLPQRAQAGAVNLADIAPRDAGNIDYAPYLRAALARLGPRGGAVYMPASLNNGCIGFATSVAPQDNVRIFSDHPRAMRIVKLADVPLFDLSGSPGGDGANQRKAVTLESVTLAGARTDGNAGAGGYGTGYNMAWTKPLVLAHYSQFHAFRRVLFATNWGRAVYGVKWWDSLFADCRFDNLGDATATCWAVHIARQGQGSVPGDYLFAEDNSNNVNFTGQTVFEQNRNGAIFIDGRRADGTVVPGDPMNNRFDLGPLKIESASAKLASPPIRIDATQIVRFSGMLDVVVGATYNNLDSIVRISDCNDVRIPAFNYQGINWSSYWPSSAGIGSIFRARRNVGLHLDLATGYVDANNKHTGHLVDIDGTNAGVQLGTWRYIFNPGGAALTNIGAATFEYRHIGRGLRAHVVTPATTLGAVTHKVEVVDNAGNTVCWLPGYNSIT